MDPKTTFPPMFTHQHLVLITMPPRDITPASRHFARSSPNRPSSSSCSVDPPYLPPPRDRKRCRGAGGVVGGIAVGSVVVVVVGGVAVDGGVVAGYGGSGGGRSPAPKTSCGDVGSRDNKRNRRRSILCRCCCLHTRVDAACTP